MAITPTPNLGLMKQDYHDPRWDKPLNATLDILDRLHCTCPGRFDKLITNGDIADVVVYSPVKEQNHTWMTSPAKSWHSEPVGTHRGATRDFPDTALIVLAKTALYIFDSSDHSLWMLFEAVDALGDLWWSDKAEATACDAANGKIYISLIDGSGTDNAGLLVIDFAADKMGRYTIVGSGGYAAVTISHRQDGGKTLDGTLPHLPGNQCNDVSAFEDSVATSHNKGVSIIDSSGIVALTCSASGHEEANYVHISDKGSLYYSFDSAKDLRVQNTLPAADIVAVTATSTKGLSDELYRTGGGQADLDPLKLSKQVVATDILGCHDGATLFVRNPLNPEKGMVAYVTGSYNTGWLIGDIQRCYLANSATKNRTVLHKDLTLTGAIEKEPVASGADLFGYTFTDHHYLSATEGLSKAIGADDFYISFWLRTTHSSGSDQHVFSTSVGSDAEIRIYTTSGGTLTFSAKGQSITGTKLYNDGKWHFVTLKRENGNLEIADNLDLDVSQPLANTFTKQTDFHIGHKGGGVGAFKDGHLTLFKMSLTVPTPAQLAIIYGTEKQFFVMNAKCLLHGGDNNVVAVDSLNGNFEVATDAGITQLNGLLVASTKAISGTKHISLGADETLTASDTQANVLSSSMDLVEEITNIKQDVKILQSVPPPEVIYGTLVSFTAGGFPSSVAGNTYTDMTNFALAHDGGITVDALTGKMTMKRAGTYQISVHLGLLFSAISSTNSFGVYGYINSVSKLRGRAGVSKGSEGAEIYVFHLEDFNVGDILEFKFYTGLPLTSIRPVDASIIIQKI